MAATATAALISTHALAQGDWLVSKDKPATIGVQVASGSHNESYPDVKWTANVGGLLQVVSYDNDPKCSELGHKFELNTDKYPVPTATGPCEDPQDNLYSSRTFSVLSGDVAKADTHDDSGSIKFNFATNTPQAAQPSETPTFTPTPTNTPTPTATATNTPIPVEALPPAEVSACLSMWTVPELPDAIGEEGFVVDIYVDAVNAQGYTLYDGTGYLYFEEQPLVGIRILPNRSYTVDVGNADAVCAIGGVPTGLIEDEQPILYDKYVYMPILNR